MGGVAALAVCVPLLAAAVAVALSPVLPGYVVNLFGAAAAAATTGLCFALLAVTGHDRVIVWFGGWEPRHGNVAVGIDFAVDRFGAGMAALVAILVTAALAYSWRYFEEAGGCSPRSSSSSSAGWSASPSLATSSTGSSSSS